MKNLFRFFRSKHNLIALKGCIIKNLRHCYSILHWLLMVMLKVEGAPHYYWDRGESGAHESRARVESSAWLEAGAGWEEWWQVVMRVSTTTSLHLHYSSAHDPLMDDAGTGNIDMLDTCTSSSIHSFMSNKQNMISLTKHIHMYCVQCLWLFKVCRFHCSWRPAASCSWSAVQWSESIVSDSHGLLTQPHTSLMMTSDTNNFILFKL